METILEYKGIKLIKKYDKLYLRFIGGQREEIPCDLIISNQEAMGIISNNELIKEIRNKYKKSIPWTQAYFMDSYFYDYLKNECNMSEGRISSEIEILDYHKDIKIELYETLMYEEFPQSGAIKVCGYSAEEIYKTTHINIYESYKYLIYLREEPEKTLEVLKKGLL